MKFLVKIDKIECFWRIGVELHRFWGTRPDITLLALLGGAHHHAMHRQIFESPMHRFCRIPNGERDFSGRLIKPRHDCV